MTGSTPSSTSPGATAHAAAGSDRDVANRDAPNRALERELSIAELVSRVLDRGAVIGGEVVISVAGVDLIYLGLQLVVSGTESLVHGGSAGVAARLAALEAAEAGASDDADDSRPAEEHGRAARG